MKDKNYLKALFSLMLFFSILCWAVVTEGYDQCSCREDRVLKLQAPYFRGDDIRTLQKRLKEMGYYHAVIDGIYGLLTAEGVARFKQENQLKADGIMDQMSWDLLGLVSSPLTTNLNSIKPQGELSIVINLDHRTLILYEKGKPFKIYPVAIGKGDSRSPVGEWQIQTKYKRIDGGVLGKRWIGLNVPWGVYGIHGTNKPWEIGTAASLGCIRMHNHHVEQLFDWVSIKMPVKIIGKRERVKVDKVLQPGHKGKQVMELQLALRKKGLYTGYLDAYYSNLTESAVKELERKYGLKPDGIADFNVLLILSVVE